MEGKDDGRPALQRAMRERLLISFIDMKKPDQAGRGFFASAF